MRTTLTRNNVTWSQIGTASVLLLGVLAMGYGYFQPNKVALYVGLMVTAAGVLTGALLIALHGHR